MNKTLKQLAEELVEKIPKRGISRSLRKGPNPKLVLLAECYLADIDRNYNYVSEVLELCNQTIDSFFSRFNKIVPLAEIKKKLSDRGNYYDTASQFECYFNSLASQKKEAKYRRRE